MDLSDLDPEDIDFIPVGPNSDSRLIASTRWVPNVNGPRVPGDEPAWPVVTVDDSVWDEWTPLGGRRKP